MAGRIDDCCRENITDAKWVSRAKWICPKCGEDVSLMYILLKEAAGDYNVIKTRAIIIY